MNDYIKVIIEGKEVNLDVIGVKRAICTCGEPTYILKNPNGRRFTRCSYCKKEYLEVEKKIIKKDYKSINL